MHALEKEMATHSSILVILLYLVGKWASLVAQRVQSLSAMRDTQVQSLGRDLMTPMDCSPPGSSIHGIFHARVLEWGAIAVSSTP